jgi:prepilin signal peptidase PulO-like enzyme (type II secretory pathway)
MSFSLAAIALVPGLAFGSFLNVVAARVPRKRSIVSPGSACMSCGNELAWYDNVPVISYLVLRGRCRGCGTSIGLVYPAVELLAALLVAACFLVFGFSGDAFVGDEKRAFLLGAMLGRTAPVGLMAGMVAGLIPSAVLFMRYGMKARKMKIPFAPFLALGGIVALFFGDALLDAYLTRF